jgi:hypothetical protein
MGPFPDRSKLLANTGAFPGAAPPADTASPASRLPLAGGILFAVIAEAFLLVALTISRGAQLGLVQLGVPIISGLFALGSCLLVSMAVQGRERGAWVLLGLACLGMLVAQGTRFLPLSPSAALTADQSASYPSIAAAALLIQSLGFFLAFLLLPPSSGRRSSLARLGLFFDGVLVVGAALVAVMYFVLVPFVQTTKGVLSTAEMTTLALCVGDLLLLGALTYALRAVDPRNHPLYSALSILGLAMFLLVGADFVNMVQTPNHLASLDSPLQAFWNAGYLAIGLGALLRLRSGGRASSAEDEPAAPLQGFNGWLALPFVLTIMVAAGIVAHAFLRAQTSTELLVSLICASLLAALLGARHLVSLVEFRQIARQRLALERELKLAEQEVEKLGTAHLAQARARRDSLNYVLDTLTRFGYGDYQARVGALERELAPLAEQLNALLDGIERQLNDRDRGRETRLLNVLTDALGRLALGELHDLPELPTPGGSPLDGLMMSVVQVRNRLMSLQGMVQQYEQEQYAAQQQLDQARQELDQETQSQRLMAQELTQNLQDQLYSERQVAQATEEQWQRERQRLTAQIQAAEKRSEELETMLHGAEQRLVNERLEAEQRLKAMQPAPEILPLETPLPDPAQLAQVRQQSEYLISQFTAQAERLHTAAVTLQTAAEVAQRLSQVIQETAALPELQSASQPAKSAAPVPVSQATPVVTQSLSALQMLERLASGQIPQTTPRMPAVTATDGAASKAAASTSGPLNELSNERVVRRLQAAASRADEIAGGLLDLAMQCIQAGDASARAATEAEKLTVSADPPRTPGLIRRTLVPPRSPKAGR